MLVLSMICRMGISQGPAAFGLGFGSGIGFDRAFGPWHKSLGANDEWKIPCCEYLKREIWSHES